MGKRVGSLGVTVQTSLLDEDQVKPFLKWAGGKSQLLNAIEYFFPNPFHTGEIENYYEPFLGGGALFFRIAWKYQKIRRAFLYDKNEDLCVLYRVIQSNVSDFIKEIASLKKSFLSKNLIQREKFFFEIRAEYNKKKPGFNYSKITHHSIERASQLLFLNKTCFNGLFRVNKAGEFNVPIGRYKNPSFFNEENLHRASLVLQKARILNDDFQRLEKDLLPKSFVYFDPPYRPISRTSSFASYSKDSFNDDEQKRLANLFAEISKRKSVFLMLSNSDPKNTDSRDTFFDTLYAGFRINRVQASRMINSKASMRGVISELIITSY